MFKKVKQFVSDNKYYIAGGVALAALLYYNYNLDNSSV